MIDLALNILAFFFIAIVALVFLAFILRAVMWFIDSEEAKEWVLDFIFIAGFIFVVSMIF